VIYGRSRHCERSEAIQRDSRSRNQDLNRQAGLLRRFAPRNDESEIRHL
jgi:hypothetical protein